MLLKSDDHPFLLWLLEHWRISSGEYQGQPYTFQRFPFLQAIAEDTFPIQVYQKSAQCGCSELAVARLLWMADVLPGNALYGFPRSSQLKEFVDARIRNAILNNPYLLKKANGAMNLHRIEFNHKQLYFRGSQFRRQMIAVDVSRLFLDEVDEMDEGVVNTMKRRLGAATDPCEFTFSTPTVPGIGINKLYAESDQRVWHTKCSACGTWSPYLWEHVLEETAQVGCQHCRRPLTGQHHHWVPTHTTNGEAHGYHISKLFAAPSAIPQMLEDRNDPLKLQELWNSDLGLPFEPQGSKLDITLLRKAWGDYTRIFHTDVPTVMGIDVGKVLHVVIAQAGHGLQQIKVLNAIETTWAELPNLMTHYATQLVVIDSLPETEQVAQFQALCPRKVFAARYPAWPQGDMELHRTNYVKYQIDINRTYAMTMVMQLMKTLAIRLPRDIEMVDHFVPHLLSPIQAHKEDEKGNRLPFFPRTGTPDHYFHALLYTMVAASMQPRTFTQVMKGWF